MDELGFDYSVVFRKVLFHPHRPNKAICPRSRSLVTKIAGILPLAPVVLVRKAKALRYGYIACSSLLFLLSDQ